MCWRKGWKTLTWSWSSRLEPNPGTPSGRSDVHGAEYQSSSEDDSVRPGARPGPTMAIARTLYRATATTHGRRRVTP